MMMALVIMTNWIQEEEEEEVVVVVVVVEEEDEDEEEDEPREEILEVSEALDKLASSDPQCAEIVKLKYFAGLTISEIGELMGIPARTVDRRWAYARAWLHQELAESDGNQPRKSNLPFQGAVRLKEKCVWTSPLVS